MESTVNYSIPLPKLAINSLVYTLPCKISHTQLHDLTTYVYEKQFVERNNKTIVLELNNSQGSYPGESIQ